MERTRNHEIEKIYMSQLRNIESAVYSLSRKRNFLKHEIARLQAPIKKIVDPTRPQLKNPLLIFLSSLGLGLLIGTCVFIALFFVLFFLSGFLDHFLWSRILGLVIGVAVFLFCLTDGLNERNETAENYHVLTKKITPPPITKTQKPCAKTSRLPSGFPLPYRAWKPN